MRKFIAFIVLIGSAFAATSTLTGTIKDAQGSPLNGTLVMRLPVPAQDVATSTAVAPTPVTFRVVNGAITGGAPLYDVLGLQPQNLYYIARAYDTTGALQFYGYYNVTGATYNLGAATPTVVTTSNVSYANVPFLSASNLFIGNNTFGVSNGVYNASSCAQASTPTWCAGAGSDLGLAITNAQTACGGSCDIYIPAGNPTIATATTLNAIGMSIHGAGSRATHIFWGGGAGTAGMIYSPSSFTILEAGTLSGFTLECTNGGIGLQNLNTQGLKIYDVAFVNCGIGLDLQNTASHWTERTRCINCYFFHNAKGIRFLENGGTNSFARTEFVATTMNINPAQIGLSVEGGANVYASRFDMGGNFDGPGAAGTFLSVDGTPSSMGGGNWFNVHIECGNATGCTGLSLAAGSNTYGQGWIDFINAGGTTTNAINSGAHFLLLGNRDPLQAELTPPIGPWLFAQTVNGESGLGLNARWDGANWLSMGDGSNNGGAVISTNIASPAGEIDFYSVPKTGGANQAISDATLVANRANFMTNGGFGTKGLYQTVGSSFAGKCSMAAGTTCTFTSGISAPSNYVSFASIDQASAPPATAISVKCAISGTTVTITAGASNSLTWDCMIVGNPN